MDIKIIIFRSWHKKVKFGGINFGGFLVKQPNPPKFLPAKISSLKVNPFKLI